jgi:hypothetical protein
MIRSRLRPQHAWQAFYPGDVPVEACEHGELHVYFEKCADLTTAVKRLWYRS